jgi:hypothetical protein
MTTLLATILVVMTHSPTQTEDADYLVNNIAMETERPLNNDNTITTRKLMDV